MNITRGCTFPACHKPHDALGLCKGHWEQQAAGKPLRPLRSYETMPVINGHKVCTRCRVFKALDDFYINNGRYKSQCKTCIKQVVAENYRTRRARQALEASSN